MSTLILVRHGPSAHVPSRQTLDYHGVLRWREEYDAAGIGAAATPPAALMRVVRNADVIVTSDMQRARESAQRLCRGHRLVESALLRETPLPIPRWPTRLPLGLWGVLIYLSWKVGSTLGAALDGEELQRVRDAAVMLADGTAPGAAGVVVTHGVFRALLADELEQQGWRVRERRGGYGHWSAWTMER